MNKKQGKLAFPHGGKSKFSENRLSLMRENKKTAKNGFPSWGKIKIQRKLAFPHGGKQKISKNQLSLMRENKIAARTDFPRGGKPKNAENHSSLVSDERKTGKMARRL